jgi:hypothetical protein
MPRTFAVPIEPDTDEEFVTFDFGPGLSPGAVINTVVSIGCTGIANAALDPAPASRILGAPTLVPSPKTGAPLAAVKVLVGQMVTSVVYQFQAVVACSDNQKLSVRKNLPCASPPGT